MKNIIIFAGGFDPIHLGHLNMAENASKQLDAEVFFEVAPISIWKDVSAPIEDKMNMVRLAIASNPRFHLDTFEYDTKKDYCYTIDTVKYFREKYPNDNLYFLLGTDQINRFHLWKECDEISKIVQLIYFDRPNYVLDKNNVRHFNMIKIHGEEVDTSATEVKDLKNLYLHETTFKYINEHELYYIKKVKSFFSTEHRFLHSLSVSETAYALAKANNLPHPENAYIAGLLHDIGKHVINSEEIMKREFPEEYKYAPLFSYHQFAGSYLAKEIFGIEDEEILNAIKYHATGRENMTVLDKIIYLADKAEPGRKYDTTEFISEGLKDIEKGFIKFLEANREFCLSKGKDLSNRLTSGCFKYYLDK